MSVSTTSSSHGPVTIAVTSGKGGVGKTNVVVNLAVALARLRHRVVVLDADFGLGNVDVLLGLAPPYHIGHLLTGERTLSEIMVNGPLGIQVIPASSGIRELTALNPRQRRRLTDALQELGGSCDFLLIDTAAGISNNVIEAVRGSHLALIVTSVDPTAVVAPSASIAAIAACCPGVGRSGGGVPPTPAKGSRIRSASPIRASPRAWARWAQAVEK
jgi:flagellar biosynthesis protein FlhG